MERQENKFLDPRQDWYKSNHQKRHNGEKAEVLWPYCQETWRCIEKQILQGAMEGKRRRGRPPTSWTNDVKLVSNQGMQGATHLASDRARWRTLVKTTAALHSAT